MNEREDSSGPCLGVDVGGTFTDAVLTDGEQIHTSKVPTTPADQSDGVMSAIRLVLERAGLEPQALTRFAHGMTVTTNALLERGGARTALLTTAGFEDVIEIGRQARPALYELCEHGPRPLVDPQLRIGLRERTGPDGVIERLDGNSLESAIDRVEDSGAEAVAICLLHSYSQPQHGQQSTLTPLLYISSSYVFPTLLDLSDSAVS